MKTFFYTAILIANIFIAPVSFAQSPAPLPVIVDPVPITPAVAAPSSGAIAVPVSATSTVVAPSSVPVAVPTQTNIKPAAKAPTSVKAAADSLSSLSAPGSAVPTSVSGSVNTSASSGPNTAQLQQLTVNAKTASDALNVAVTKLSAVRGKIAVRIDKAKSKGASSALSDAMAKLATADAKIAESRNAADNLAIVPVSKGDITAIVAALQAMDMTAKASIRQAQDTLKAALDALVRVEATIK